MKFPLRVRFRPNPTYVLEDADGEPQDEILNQHEHRQLYERTRSDSFPRVCVSCGLLFATDDHVRVPRRSVLQFPKGGDQP